MSNDPLKQAMTRLCGIYGSRAGDAHHSQQEDARTAQALEIGLQEIERLESELVLVKLQVPVWKPMHTAPVDRRILLLHPTAGPNMRVEIGQWDDQRHHKAPKPFWKYEAESTGRVNYCRQFLPVGWMDLPE